MSDYTEIESQMNKTKASNIQSRAEVKKAEAAEVHADAEKIEAEAHLVDAQSKLDTSKRKGAWSRLKKWAVYLGIGAATTTGALVGVGVGKAVSKEPHGIPDAAEKATSGVLKTVHAAGEVLEATGETAETTVKRANKFISLPDLAEALSQADVENFMSDKTNLRVGIAARNWSKLHPDMPLTAKTLREVYAVFKQFQEDEGRPMTNEELIQKASKICKWKRLPQQQKRGGR